MRRLYKILLILFGGLLVLLALYAAPPTRGTIENILGPPIKHYGGGTITAITNHPIWTDWIVPFPNQLVIGALFLGLPIAWLWHKSFNRVRGVFVRSAAKETSMYPMMTEPKSVPSPAPQPTPTGTKELPTSEAIEAEIDQKLEKAT